MSVTIHAIKTRVKFYGMFDFKQMYRDVRDKLADKGYISGDKYKWMETYYSEKESSDLREAKTIWLWWRTFKTEEDSPYYEQHMDMEFHLRYLRDVEIMVENEKRKVQKGEIEVLFNAYVLLDPKDQWENHWFLKTVHPLFYKRIWRKRREAVKNSTTSDALAIQAFVKKIFEMSSFVGFTGEEFYRPYGYKKNY